jgi:hypothetical protein
MNHNINALCFESEGLLQGKGKVGPLLVLKYFRGSLETKTSDFNGPTVAIACACPVTAIHV